jgi:hypothetical protein
MKKQLLIAAAVLITGTAAMSQEDQRNRRTENEPARTQEQVELPEAAQHGQNVSMVARETPDGPDKGAIVSEQARSKGEMKRMERAERKEMRKQEKLQRQDQAHRQDGSQIQRRDRTSRPEARPERPNRPERPTRPERPNRPAGGPK